MAKGRIRGDKTLSYSPGYDREVDGWKGAELSARQYKIIEYYFKFGSKRRALQAAGYTDNDNINSAFTPEVNAVIDAIKTEQYKESIAQTIEIKEFWTAIMRNADSDLKRRLQASKYLGETGGLWDQPEKTNSSQDLADLTTAINLLREQRNKQRLAEEVGED